MRWHEFEKAQPLLAEVGEQKLEGPGVVLVATIRKDGTPRVSPVESMVWEGDFWLGMGLGSLKALDLERDPRVLVHSIVTKRDGSDGEFKVRGRAEAVHDPDVQKDWAHEVTNRLGWKPEVGKFHLFRIDVEDVTYIRWDDANNDQFVTRWPPGEEFAHRGTSATSRGPREPFPEFLT